MPIGIKLPRPIRWVANVAAGAILAFLVWEIVVPSRLCCGADGPEPRAIRRLRSINSAQQAFASSCGNGAYARSLEDLTTPAGKGLEPFLKPEFGRAISDEYEVTMTVVDGNATEQRSCNGLRVAASYFAEAHPIDPASGRRAFATDERQTIYTDAKRFASGSDIARASPIQ